MRLDPKAFGLSAGLLWAACMFVLTLLAYYTDTGYSSQFLQIMASIYPGYSITLGGSVLGAIYGFIDGFVGGFLFVWLYNKLVK